MSDEGTGGSWLSKFCVKFSVHLGEKERCKIRQGREEIW